MRIFGWEIRKQAEAKPLPSFTPPVVDDGAVTVAAGGHYGGYIDIEGSVKNEAELISKYRQMMLHHEIDSAVKNISNETIVHEEGQKIVDIVLDDLDDMVGDSTKKAIEGEFETIQQLLKWNVRAKDIFLRFYVDGRLPYHAIIDEKQPQAGIQELRYIDPRKIRKVREVEPAANVGDPTLSKVPGLEMVTQVKNEYFIFNPRGFVSNANPSFQYSSPTTGLKIAKDSILYVTSGITNETGTMVLSHLHKAIKPLNQLRALEDAAIIYRLARAPERRVFYIDTGNLPRIKAEQYIQQLMTKFKNRLVYNAETGEIQDNRKMMTMLEDFWLARRESGGTEVDTLPGGDSSGVIDEVEFFKQRLYDALNVPFSRTHPESMFQGMNAGEISRDEINFGMFIDNIRLRFNNLFLEALKKQLILKGILLPTEWDAISYKIKFTYARNNIFAELKEREVINGRLTTLQLIAPYVGRYFSNEWVRKNILKQTDEDIENMDEQVMEELQNPLYQAPLGMPEGQAMGMEGEPGMDQQGGPQGLSVQAPMTDQSQKPLNNNKSSTKKAA